MFSGCKHSISPPPQHSPSPHHNTRGEALLLTSEVPQLLPEVIDLENDNITSTSRLLENDESARTESIAQTPLLNEPVTGPLNIGASVVADVAVLHKPVTDLCNTAQSVVDMREPSAAPIDLSTGTVSVVLPEVVPEAFSVPFKVRVDDTDTDIVDFETFSDSEGSTLPTSDSIRQEQVNGHAEGIVRAWNDYEITGLKIMRGTANLADALSNVTRHFFYNNNKPKPGLFWTDLFSNNVIPTVHRNDETGRACLITRTRPEPQFRFLIGFVADLLETPSSLITRYRMKRCVIFAYLKNLLSIPLCHNWVSIKASFNLTFRA